jgi:hypothetical protein
LKDFIAEALNTKDTLLKRVISTASESLVNDLQDMGITIAETQQLRTRVYPQYDASVFHKAQKVTKL